ncbi:hypothetical protein KUCAC02_005921, partial [Chaenocephalus aceratus]
TGIGRKCRTKGEPSLPIYTSINLSLPYLPLPLSSPSPLSVPSVLLLCLEDPHKRMLPVMEREQRSWFSGEKGGRESRPFEDNASQIDCGTAIVHSYITAELKLGMNPSPSLSLCVCVDANLKNASKPTFDRPVPKLIIGGSNTVVISLIKTL